MNLKEYSSYDGVGLADLIRTGAVSKTEIANYAVSAVNELNPMLNAVVEVYQERTAVSNELSGEDRPFDGVPFMMKDLGSFEGGKNYELGSRLAKGLQFEHDSELVKRYKSSGFNILGRTTTPEFGGATITESSATGITKNPWSLMHSPGGSSGGSAVVVAAGIVPIAHATDLAGSIRIPSGFCGLVGLKPSRNLNPVGPDVGQLFLGLATEHVLTKSVRDTAAVLDATAGPAPGEFYHTPRHPLSYLSELYKPFSKLNIALNLEPWIKTQIDPEVIAAVIAAAQLCSSLGHHVDEQRFDVDEQMLVRCMETIWASYTASGVIGLAGLTGREISEENLERSTLSGYHDGSRYSAVDLIQAIDYSNVIARVTGGFFEEFDVMITPTNAIRTPLLGSADANGNGIKWHDWVLESCKVAPFGQVFNISGVPAITLPLGTDSQGLPIGVTFSSRIGNEAMLLRLAAQLEIAAPWNKRIAPYHMSLIKE